MRSFAIVVLGVIGSVMPAVAAEGSYGEFVDLETRVFFDALRQDHGKKKVSVPMPTRPADPSPRASAEQVVELARVAADFTARYGAHGLFNNKTEWLCVDAGSEFTLTMSDGSTGYAKHCLRARGKVHGGKYELESVELRVDIYVTGTRYIFGRNAGQEIVKAAEIAKGTVKADGSVHDLGSKFFVSFPLGFNMPSPADTIRGEIAWWAAYKS